MLTPPLRSAQPQPATEPHKEKPQLQKVPRPNDPFRDQIRKFLNSRVKVTTEHTEFDNCRVISFDMSSKAVVIEVDPKRRILLSHYRTIEILSGV